MPAISNRQKIQILEAWAANRHPRPCPHCLVPWVDCLHSYTDAGLRLEQFRKELATEPSGLTLSDLSPDERRAVREALTARRDAIKALRVEQAREAAVLETLLDRLGPAGPEE